jgi:hypothetical protein
MSVWQVVLLVNLALAVGLGFGYARWGRQMERLEQELKAARALVERLEQEREARPTGARAGEQQWEARGVVRAIFPDADLLVITHEEIPGFLPARTTGFKAASRKIHDAARVGDAIRFTLRGKSRDVVIVAIEIWQGARALVAPRAGA